MQTQEVLDTCSYGVHVSNVYAYFSIIIFYLLLLLLLLLLKNFIVVLFFCILHFFNSEVFG